ncbi:MAG TPA: gamma-glutamyltransferase [Chloroflexota bacterium]|nr:gamma-glutamyltransferase [Chloroflexota bacterium]
MSLPRTGRQPVLATRGAVAAPHYAASQAGLTMLQRGGSATDAAIAANAVLAVVYPHMAGLGGDLFALVWDASKGELSGLNASGRSGIAATIDWYTSRGHATIPARGPLACVTVPGAVDGWWQLHQQGGKLAWDTLFEPAIELATDGFAVPESLAAWSIPNAEILDADPTARATFRPSGRPLRMGERLAMPSLATTLRTVARHGPDAFYQGEIAEKVCDYLQAGGGLLTPDDFAANVSTPVRPITTTYRGRTVCQLPPNTQGFAALELLGILEGLDVAALGDSTAAYVHTLAETARLAFQDRDRYLTDPDFHNIPLDRLVSPEHAADLRARLDPDRKGAPESTPTGGGTCYLCAVDRDGNAVSLIQSVFFDFGSGVVAGDTGLLLQNRGSFFSLDPTHPNRLEPRKRTFHTLIPAMLLTDGQPTLVYGTMGGEGQPQTQAALVTRILDFGYDVQRAVDAPRWLYGRTWGTQSAALSLEEDIGPGVADRLAAIGHDVRVVPAWSDTMGHAQAIQIDRERGVYWAAADPRSDGAAAGW